MIQRILLSFTTLFLSTAARSEPTPSFRSDVAPILLNHCAACHCAKKAEGGYRVDTFDELGKSGDSGAAPIDKAKQEASELLRRLTTTDPSERMPAESKPLTPAQIELMTAWIEAGAEFDGDDSSALLPFVIPPPRHSDPPESYPKPIPIAAIAFSPDGKHLLASGYHEITVWDGEQGTLVRRIGNVDERIFAIEFDSDGKLVAVACGSPGRSGELRLIDFATGEVKAVAARATDVVLDVAFRPGRRQIAVASADNAIRILNVDTLDVVRTMASHADWVTAVDWSNDGSRLVSASRDQSAKVFDAESGQLLVTYRGHGAAVRGVAVMPDGKQVISTGSDNHLHRWNMEAAKRVAHIPIGEGYGPKLAAEWAIIPCADRRLVKVDLATNSITGAFQGHGDWVLSAALSPDLTRVASGSHDGEIRLWSIADGSLLKAWRAKP